MENLARIPLLALLIQGLPENIALVSLAFVLAKIPLQWKKILFIAVVSVIIAYFVRLLPIGFGIHTILIVEVLFLLLIKLGKATVINALRASLISLVILTVVEMVCLNLIVYISGIPLETLFANTATRILVALPQVVIISIIAIAIKKIPARRQKPESLDY